MTAAAPVAEYGTGLQLTRVLRDPDGAFLWWHLPGPQRTGPLTAPAAHLVPEPPAASGAAELAVPEPLGDGLLHRAAGSASVAAWLRDPRPQARRLAAHSLVAGARALRELHRVRVPADTELRIPPGLRRLGEWARGGEGLPAGALRLREAAARAWGEERLTLLLDWAAQAADPADGTLVHGWASVGALIPPLSRGRAALLTGEDLAVGRPELDLGWTLGDLAEIAWSAPYFDYDGLAEGFLDAYGSEAYGNDAARSGAYGSDSANPDTYGRDASDNDTYGRDSCRPDAYRPPPDPVLVGRAAVLRVATHMQDFASFCEWSDELHDYIDFTAELIDEEGRRAVPQGVS
ncbi:hypothetical protein AB0M39_04360 [Streptomyces sp. NPDC051907]|uniref:hypothetical protein n=1 Tax=Streptomyces sp. NPDC051907 TaxID=3155284 RepID=UPI00341E9B81